MTYEEYRARGFYYADYMQLSQYQRLRGLIQDWRESEVKDKGWYFYGLWMDAGEDFPGLVDWWRPRNWKLWRFGIDQCQNFHHVAFGPMEILFAT